MQIAYLSADWLAEAASDLSKVVIDPPIDGPPLALDTIVTGDGDPIRFRYMFSGAHVSLVDPEAPVGEEVSVVRITQSRSVATAVASGERSAQEAFLTNDIQLGGEVTRLIQLADLLQQVGDALAPLRARTAF
ncbi:MAG: hypothetical protein GX868_07560 [Actinobacteria bacterium]|nr:hypothetical protein [Actinomycetota bacterium]